MLKIYLDWNSINNIQTRHPKLYELIKEYGHLFIFPYSNAHIRDLIVSMTLGTGSCHASEYRAIEQETKTL